VQGEAGADSCKPNTPPSPGPMPFAPPVPITCERRMMGVGWGWAQRDVQGGTSQGEAGADSCKPNTPLMGNKK